MDKRFAVRRVRPRDLDRILEIEAASFGADAYDRNLFAEYTRKCGELFLVALRGTKVFGYVITCISRPATGRTGLARGGSRSSSARARRPP